MTIHQLSQEVGIGIDTLRVWERRYGFPSPGRDSRGHRTYPAEQVEELRTVRKLLTRGLRPGKVLGMPATERNLLLAELIQDWSAPNENLASLARDVDPHHLESYLRRQLRAKGVKKMLAQDVLPLIYILDSGWTSGSISIAREHLISDAIERVLADIATADIQGEVAGSILFLTLSGEHHKLGLLLAATLFREEGYRVILLGRDLPVSEVSPLAEELGVDAVAASFSSHYSPKRARQNLASLRNELSTGIHLVAGGQAVSGGISMQGLDICTEIEQIPGICKKLSRRQASKSTSS